MDRESARRAVVKATTAIEECGSEWVVTWPNGDHTRSPTAAEAQKAVKQAGRALAAADVSSAFTVVWTTHTRVGRWVVSAITDGCHQLEVDDD